jgi:hypothetical protein
MIDKLEIDRARWGRNCLLSPYDNKMCCLGFLSKAYGAQDSEMRDVGYPLSPWEDIYSIPRMFVGRTDFTCSATFINDSVIPAPERESQLTKLFADNGIALTFIGNFK